MRTTPNRQGSDRNGPLRQRRRGMGPLLTSSALIALAAGGTMARGQSFLGNASVTLGAVEIATGSGTTTLNVGSTTSVIDWTPTGPVNGTGQQIFQQSGTTATFVGATGLSDYTVLNRITPSSTATPIRFDGNVLSQVAGGATGGNVWFYSPGGIIVGATARFDVGSLILTTNPIDVSSGVPDPTTGITFGAALQANAAVTVEAPSASDRGIYASNAGSYVAMVAPRIDQGGMVSVNGSVGYIAAAAADVTINAGLFSISNATGSTVATPGDTTLSHTGTTTGAAADANGTPHVIYMVAVPQNDAVTMLVSGNVGYQAATDATVINGTIELQAGAADSITRYGGTGAGTATLGAGTYTSPILGYATGRFDIDAATGNIALYNAQTRGELGTSLTVRAGRTLQSDGDINLIDDVVAAGTTLPITVEAGGTLDLTGAQLYAQNYGNAITFDVAGTAKLNSLYLPSFDIRTTGTATATGGSSSVTVNGGALTVFGGATLDATARAGGSGGISGDSNAGSASLVVTNNGTATINNLDLNVSTITPVYPVTNAGGTATAGSALVRAASGGTITVGGTLSIDARSQGLGDSANVATVTGGAVNVIADGGTINLTAPTALHTIDASAAGGNALGDGVSVYAVNAGTLTIAGGLSVSVAAANGDGATVAAQGGAIDLGAQGGGLSIAGATTLTATASSGAVSAAGAAAGYDANGGQAVAQATGGTTLTLADLTIDDSSIAVQNPGIATGSAIGGTGILTATTGGTIALSGALLIDSSANANSLGNGAITATGGTAQVYADGGTINLTSTTASFEIASDAQGGIATGGIAELLVDTGGRAAVSNALSVHAQGFGGGAAGGVNGYAGIGGIADVTALNGTITATALDIRGSGGGGLGTATLEGGSGFGGSATIAAATNGTVTATGYVSVFAEGNAGTGGTGAAIGTGGTAQLSTTGGTLTFTSTTDPVNLLVFAGGTGSAANVAGRDPISGGIGRGGTARIGTGGGGSVAITGNAVLNAGGNGGLAALGGTGGTGRGGTVSVNAGSVTGGSGTISAGTLQLNAFANGGNAGTGGVGGAAVGGTARMTAVAGTISGTSLDLSARTVGGSGAGSGGFGGGASGGTATVTVGGGTINFATASVLSRVIGGAGGSISDGGAASGGSATVSVTSGVLSGGGWSVASSVTGGAGGAGDATALGVGGTGGAATGGAATLTVSGGTPAVAGINVSSTAIGGAGGRGADVGSGSGFGGGVGGAATAGAAQLAVSGGTLNGGAIALASTATGGVGGDGGNANPSGVGGAAVPGGTGGAGGGALSGTATIAATGGALTGAATSLATTASAGTGGVGGQSEPNSLGVTTQAASGTAGAGTGGTTQIATSGAGTIALGATSLATGSQNGATNTAGSIILSTAATSGPAPLSLASLTATTTADQTDASRYIQVSAAAPITVAGDASITGTTLARFDMTGAGQLAVGGALTLDTLELQSTQTSPTAGLAAITASSATLTTDLAGLQLTTIAVTPGDLTLDSAAGIAIGTASARTINATAAGDTTATNLTAINDLTLQAGGLAMLTTATAGDDLRITAGSADLQTISATRTGGSDNEGDGSNITVATTGALNATSATSAFALTLSTQGGALTGTTLSAGTALSATTTGAGTIDIQTSTAANDITLTAQGNAAITTSGITSTNGSVRLTGGTITAGDASGQNVILISTGDVSATDLTAISDLAITANTGAVTLTTGTAGDDLTIAAASADLQTISATRTGGSDNEGDGSNIRITTTGALGLTSANSAFAIALEAGSDGVGAITADQLVAGTTIDVTTDGTGALALQTINAAGNITLTARGGGTIGATGLTSTSGSVAVNGGAFTVGDIAAGRDIVLTSTGDFGASGLTAGNDLTVNAAGGVTIDTATAGDDLRINAARVDLTTLSATRTGGSDNEGDGSNIVIATTTGDLDVSQATSAFATTLTTQQGDINADTLSVGTTLTITNAGAGTIALQPVTAGGDIVLTAQGNGPITATGLTSTTGSVRVTGGAFTVGDIAAGRDIILTSTGDFSANDLTANNDVTVQAGGTATIDTATAGDDVRIAATGVQLTTLSATRTGGSDNEGDGSNIVVATTTGDLDISQATSAFATQLSTQQGNITADTLTVGTTLTVTNAGAGTIALQPVTAGGDITLTAQGGGPISATGLTSTGGSVSVNGGGFTVGDVKAGRDVLLVSTGDVTATNLTANNDITVQATAGTATLTTATAGDDVRVTAGIADLRTISATRTGGSDNEGDGSNIVIATTGDLGFTQADAAFGIALTSQTGAITAAMLNAGTGVSVTSVGAGAIGLQTVNAGGAITLQAQGGGGITATGIASTGDSVSVSGASFAVDTVTAARDVTLTATGTIAGSGITAGNDLTANGGAVSITTGTAGDDIRITGTTATLGTLSANRTGGSDNEGDGSNIVVSTTGDLNLTRADAAFAIALTTQTGTITAPTLNAGTGIAATSVGAGVIGLGNVAAAGPVTLQAQGGGGIAATSIASSGDSVSVTGATLAVDTVTAGRDVSLNTTGALTVNTGVTANNDLSIAAGTLSLPNATAGDDIRITGTTATLGTLAANRTGGSDNEGDGSNIVVSTTGDLSLASGTAAFAVSLTTQTGTITATALNAGTGVTATNVGTGAIRLQTLNAAGPVTLQAQGGGAITATSIASTGDSVSVNSGVFTVDTVTAGRDIALTTTGAVAANGLTANNDLTIAADTASLANATAGDDIRIAATSATLGTLSATRTGGSDNEGDGANLVVATTGNLSLASGTAAFAVSLASSGGSVTASTLSAGTTVDLSAGGAGGITVGAITAPGAVTATAAVDQVSLSGLAVGSVSASGATQVTLAAPGALTVASVSGAAIDVTSGGDLTFTSPVATGTAQVNAGGALSLATLQTGGDATLLAGSTFDATTLTIGGSLDARSTGALRVGTASAGIDLSLISDTSVDATTLTAGRDLEVATEVTAGDTVARSRDVTLGSATAGDDVIVAAYGAIVADSLTATGLGQDGTQLRYADIAGSGVATLSGEGARIGSISASSSADLGNYAFTVAGQAISDGTGALDIGQVTVGTALTLFNQADTVAARNIVAPGGVSATGTSVTLAATGPLIVTQAIATAGDVDLSASDLTLGTISATGAIDLTVGNSLVFDTLVHDGDLTIATGGDLTGNVLTSNLGSVDLTVGGNATLGTLSAGDTATARVTGIGRFGTVTAGTYAASPDNDGGADFGSAGLYAGGDLTVGDVTALGSIGLLSRTGTLSAGNLTAGANVAALGGGAITLGAITAPRLLYIGGPSAVAGLPADFGTDDVIALLGAAGPVASGGAVTTGAIASGTAMIDAGDALTIGGGLTATTGGAMLLAGGAITAQDITAAGTLGVRGASGAVTLGNLAAGTPTDGGALMVMADGGAVQAGTVTAVESIGVASSAGTVTLGDVESSGGLVRISGSGDLALGDVRAAGSIFLTGGAAITAGDLTAGTGPLFVPRLQDAALTIASGSDPATAGIAGGFDGTALQRCDDCSSDGIALPFTINYFGQSYGQAYVSSNGYLTFGAGQSEFSPEGLGTGYSGLPILAAFFADVDTSSAPGAQVTYGIGTFAGRQAFGATWNGVGYFDNHYDKLNKFQIILTNRADTGTGNFDVYYNYGAIAWETGDVDGGTNGLGGQSASVGYNAGTGNQPGTFFSQPGSLVPGSFLDNGTAPLILATNDGNPGQLLFSVRNGSVIGGGGDTGGAATINVTNIAAGNTAAVRLGNLSAEATQVHGAGDVTVGAVTTIDKGTGASGTGLPFVTVLDATGNLISGDIAGSGLVALGATTGDVSTGSITTPTSVAVLAGGAVQLGQVTTGQGATDTLFVGGADSTPLNFAFDGLVGGTAFDPATLATATLTRTGGAIGFGGPISTGNLRAAASGPITIGAASATNMVSLNTAGLLSVNGAIDGGSISLASGDIALDTRASLGSDRTTELAFANSGTRATFVGDDAGATQGAYALSAAELAASHAGAISITAPGDAVLGTLSLTGAGVTSGANLVGAQGGFSLVAANDIRLVGAFAASQLAAGNTVSLSARNAITGTLPAARIALSGSDGGLAGTLSLQAGTSIQFATATALDGLATASLADAETRLATPVGTTDTGGYLRADTVRFTIGDGLYAQNTGPSTANADRAGVTAGAGGISIFGNRSEDTTTPFRLILNARLDSKGVVTTGLDVVAPVLAAVGQNTTFAQGSTINGCVLGSTASCGAPIVEEPDRAEIARSIQPVQDVVTQVQLPSGLGNAEAYSFDTPTLVSLVDLSPLSVAPLIDEPVTGAGNDDLWVGIGLGAERDLAPMGGAKPAAVPPQ